MGLSYSNNSVIAMNYAAALAQNTGGMLNPEHILFGLLKVPGTAAFNMLSELGLNADDIENAFQRLGHRERVLTSTKSRRVLDGTVYFAQQFGRSVIEPELILYSLIKEGTSAAVAIIARTGANLNEMLLKLEAFLNSGGASGQHIINITIRPSVDDLFRKSALQDRAQDKQDEEEENKSKKKEEDVNLDDLFDEEGKDIFNEIFGDGSAEDYKRRNRPIRKRPDESEGSEDSRFKELDKFGVDLVELAKQGKVDPVIGRDKEIESVIEVLSRRTKNNPCIIGDPGVGKTAIVNGLALAIAQNKVPDGLQNKHIFSLDVTSLVAGTRYRGDFEERLKKAIDEIKKGKDTILFIDEIHMIMKAGDSSDGAMNMANIIKPLLSRGELQTIGATTISEYRKHIEKDQALERRFQPLMIAQPSVYDTIQILKGIKDKYEAYHNVKITDSAIEAAASLSDRYIADRFLPDKAIDLIDTAAAKKKMFTFAVPKEIRELEDKIKDLDIRVKDAARHEMFAEADSLSKERDALNEQKEQGLLRWEEEKKTINLTIGEDEIAQLVAQMTKIPVTRITQSEGEKVADLDKVLKQRVIGQDEAVDAVARSIKRSRAGIQNPNRPIGSFILLGPTGVGKTELSKALAEALFGDENALIRVDMSEYMEKESVSKMTGSAPGYVGYDEGGQLTEKVRRKPYSVVLFDEIEKAHPDIFNILLQVLDDGRLTDSHGRTVSFKNTVVLLTSNIGASEINKTRLGFGSTKAEDEYEEMKSRQLEALKKAMKPEFINRLDDILIFHKLRKEDTKKICVLMLNSLAKRMKDNNITVEFTDAAVDFIVSKGYNEEYGARPLRRTIQKYVEDKLSDMILRTQIVLRDSVVVDSDGNELTFNKK